MVGEALKFLSIESYRPPSLFWGHRMWMFQCLTVNIRREILFLLLSVFYSLSSVILFLSTSHFLCGLLDTDDPVIQKLIKPDPILVWKGIVTLDGCIQFVVPSLQVIIDVNKTSCYAWIGNKLF